MASDVVTHKFICADLSLTSTTDAKVLSEMGGRTGTLNVTTQ